MKNINMNNNNIIPMVTYNNINVNKFSIISNNKGKSGIYRWNNLITGKSYVGSSVSLSHRFTKYYSLNYLKSSTNNGSSIIYNALLKYGYSNFSLNIIEYCAPSLLTEREQYYIDLLKPEYNILKTAGSRSGYVQSKKTRELISKSLRNRLIKLLPIKVTNIETNTIKRFASNEKAAKYLGTSVNTLVRYKSKGKLLFNLHLITNDIYMNKSYKELEIHRV